MSDTLIFQISARNIDPEIVISELGLGTSISRTGTGCIWRFEISKPVSKNQPDRLIREILNRFAGKKAFLRSLRDGGSDLVIIWLPQPRKGFFVLGLKWDLMEKLSEFGISLNCPYFEHKPA